ncbi:hypothetical protein V9L05_18400 [Bernardetia sp. Wsw4-3y2]|uniref:hypothetical protein n=1 Tax=Bernardetia sp. Wsw4-3y2 TaxID=3127471 RepID=UPI0030CCC9BB
MKYKFQLPNFPNSIFEIEKSIWTGKSKLHKDNVLVERSKEKGKPFLIPTDSGQVVKAYPRSASDFTPTLEIDGVKHHVASKLEWFQYVLGGLPMLLVIVGGALGALIGMLGVYISYDIFRQNSSTLSYLKVVGVIVASYFVYFVVAILITMLIQ